MPDARSLPGLGIFQLARLGRSGSEPLESSLALSGALHRSALGNAFFAAFDREREGSTPAIWANPEATTPVPPVGILPLGDEALIQPAAHYVLFERDSHLVRFVSRAPRHFPPHASVGLDAPQEKIPEPLGGNVRLPLPSVHGVREMAIVIPASSHDAHGPCPGLSIDVGARGHALAASARALHGSLGLSVPPVGKAGPDVLFSALVRELHGPWATLVGVRTQSSLRRTVSGRITS